MKSPFTLQILSLCTGLLANTAVVACELHAGFGGWSGFGRHSNAALIPPEEQITHKMVLSVPAMVNTREGETTELTITYTFASEAEQPSVELTLDPSSALSVTGSPRVLLNGKTAQHVFQVSANRTGVHRIGVVAQSLDPQELEQAKEVIFVRASKP